MIQPEKLLQIIWEIGFVIVLLSGIFSDVIFQRNAAKPYQIS